MNFGIPWVVEYLNIQIYYAFSEKILGVSLGVLGLRFLTGIF
jgi:hypothetical protein